MKPKEGVMFNRQLFGVLMVLSSLASQAANVTEIPKALGDQIARVSELLRDPYATEYPEARMAQRTRTVDDEPIMLVVFTLEGFGGGNNHTQYLAAFEPEARDGGVVHYRLLDVIPIGGKGWRSIEELNARIQHDPRSRETVFTLDVRKNGPSDALNFPTIRSVTRVMLKDGRLRELSTANSAGT